MIVEFFLAQCFLESKQQWIRHTVKNKGDSEKCCLFSSVVSYSLFSSVS